MLAMNTYVIKNCLFELMHNFIGYGGAIAKDNKLYFLSINSVLIHVL